MVKYTKQFIDGEWVDSESADTIDVINPATEEVFQTVAAGNKADVDKAVAAAKKAYLSFRNTDVKERVALLERIADEYEKRKDDIVDTITNELGSPIDMSENGHYSAGLNHFRTTAEVLKDFQFEERRGDSLVMKESIGVAGLITPWNFPTNQTALKLAAAFAAGSTVVLKPSEETPITACILAEIFQAAGVPKGVFNLVNGDGEGVCVPLSEHPDVRMMSFTGSGPTGRSIMEKAAQDFKKVALELGGKSPLIVLDDADLDEAARIAVGRVVRNTGQVCTAATRTLVPKDKVDEFVEKATAVMSEVNVGDPRAEDTEMGPLISKKQFDRVQSYITKGQEEGATLHYGGSGKPDNLSTGYFVKPTIFTGVNNDMVIAQEEIFGPVMSVLAYDDLDQAIEIANDTVYGLAGYVVGKDKEQLKQVARSIEAGTIAINEEQGTNDLPFGGYKQSGIGREWGDYGIEEFLEVKSIKGYYA